MMHLIKRFIVVAAVACLVPAIAFASTARLTGLNVPGDYVKDYTGMFTYLSCINSTGNLIYGEAGSVDGWNENDDRAMGAVLPNLFDGKAGVWAIHMRQFHPAIGQSWWGGPISSGLLAFDPNLNAIGAESFDLMWGTKVGTTNVGVRVNRQFFSYDDGTTTTEGNGNYGRNIFGFGAGLGFDMNENTSLEIAAHFQSRTFDEGDAVGDLSEDGGAAMLLAGRAWMKSGTNLTLVPVVKWWSIDQSSTDGVTTFDEKWSGWQAGLAGNWAVGQNDLFILGANIAGNKIDYGDPEITETLTPNLFMALETQLNPWLTFRLGAQQQVYSTFKQDDGVTTQTTKYSDFSWAMGTSVKMGNVMFDAQLDPLFLNNPFGQLLGSTNGIYEGVYHGPSFGTAGSPTSGTVFPQVSLTYTW